MTTVRGIIVPVDWDDKGKVKAVAISTHHEEEFIIHRSYDLNKLLKIIHQKVEVTGTVEEKPGEKVIKVQRLAQI